MQAHIEHHGVDTTAGEQQFVAALRVGLHGVELGLGELAGLVEHIDRHHRLAQVVQHAGLGRQPGLRFVLPQLLGQRHHQRGHRHRMHVGVVVVGLQAGQRYQRRRIAPHRLGDLGDHLAAFFGVDRAAHAGLVEQRHHRRTRLGAQRGRTPDFFIERDLGLRRHLGGSREIRSRFGIDRRQGHRGAHRRLAESRRHIKPLGHVDPALGHPAVLKLFQVDGITQHEFRLPERVVQPGTAHLVQVHAQAQLVDGNFLEHETELLLWYRRTAGRLER